MSEPWATRREVDQLAGLLAQIDQHGTRGTVAAVTGIAAQLAESIKDIGELKGQLAAHERQHEIDRERARTDRADRERARTAARRWLIGVVLTILALLISILAVVVPLAVRSGA